MHNTKLHNTNVPKCKILEYEYTYIKNKIHII